MSIAEDMVEVGFRDLFGISIVMGVMTTTMSTMLVFFYTGLEGDLAETLKMGGFCGGAVASVTLVRIQSCPSWAVSLVCAEA